MKRLFAVFSVQLLAVCLLWPAASVAAEEAKEEAAATEPAKNVGQFNLMAKGGLGHYTGGLRGLSKTGPTWGAVVNVQPTRVLGLEAAYDGSSNPIGNINTRSRLNRNGASAMVKLGLPLLERYRPFVAGGYGVSYVHPTGEGAVGFQNDLVQEVPVSAGLEFNASRVTAGVRATYRVLMHEGFAPGNPNGGLFDTALTLGGRF